MTIHVTTKSRCGLTWTGEKKNKGKAHNKSIINRGKESLQQKQFRREDSDHQKRENGDSLVRLARL